MPFLGAMNAYHRDHPPIHVCMAAQVGFKKPAPAIKAENAADELMALAGELNG